MAWLLKANVYWKVSSIFKTYNKRQTILKFISKNFTLSLLAALSSSREGGTLMFVTIIRFASMIFLNDTVDVTISKLVETAFDTGQFSKACLTTMRCWKETSYLVRKEERSLNYILSTWLLGSQFFVWITCDHLGGTPQAGQIQPLPYLLSD